VPEITSAKLFLNGFRENIKCGLQEAAQNAYLTLCRIEDDMVLMKYEHKGLSNERQNGAGIIILQRILVRFCIYRHSHPKNNIVQTGLFTGRKK